MSQTTSSAAVEGAAISITGPPLLQLTYNVECSNCSDASMVRRIVFTDGISWVARIRLPQLEAVFGDREVLDVVSTLKVEMANRKFRQQMAGIQATLSSFTFDQIGSLYWDEQTSDFFIGPEIETGKGPWASSTDYYADLANHALQVCVRNAAPGVETSCSFAIPILFKHLMSLYGHSSPMRGPFSLTNRDFGAHNLLVNDDFEIVGVIDLDGVMAAPIEVVAQYPVLTGLEREPPGHVETRPAAIDRIRRTEPRLKEYKDMVEMAEARIGMNKEGNAPMANLMLSEAASVFQGLVRYGGHQKFVNDKWMEAYLKLLRGHIRSGEQQTP
ncbi:Uncharacterized protein TCAP_07596 [Tolypocladium capitatum]|uniref:Aminoglycoside phosphotransferase domain-containing protein n=1 Tax=Tolypocladium capitatum TaxID=45235 RepID=A0A2K3PSB2_9HYPO|nr:Uncharacterized protein TCAP_07596 [Tolypocladium capitatum]